MAQPVQCESGGEVPKFWVRQLLVFLVLLTLSTMRFVIKDLCLPEDVQAIHLASTYFH